MHIKFKRKELKMNISRIKIILYVILLVSYTVVYSTPIAFSRWKKSPDSKGSVIIYHDHHLILADDHFRHMSELLEKIETQNIDSKLHVVCECVTIGEHGNLMKKFEQKTFVPGQIFLAQFEHFFNFETQNVFFHNLECRNLLNIVYVWVMANLGRLTKPEDTAILPTITDCYDVCEYTTFQDLYMPHLKFINDCIEKSVEPFKSIFENLKQQFMGAVHEVKKVFDQNQMPQDIPLTRLLIDPSYHNMASPFISIVTSGLWTGPFLSEIIDVRAINYLMNTPETDTVALFVGFEHAKNIEKCLQALGYTRCYKIPNSPAPIPLRAYHEMLLDSNICANCLKVGADKFCAACKTAHYCSAECQRADWKFHKTVCSKIYSTKK